MSLRLPSGTVAAVVGANGAGKSTLLRILAGVLHPDAGSASLVGRPPGDGAGAFVPPGDRGLYWRLTGMQNLMFVARVAGLRGERARERVRLAARALDAKHLLGRRAGTCSTGERRRLALAQALVAGAPVLLLDEPYADLDEPGCEAVERVTRRWADSGGCVLYATPVVADGPRPDVRYRLADGRLSEEAA